MADHRLNEPMRSRRARLLIILAGALASLGLLAAPAMAAPSPAAAAAHAAHAGKGFLTLAVTTGAVTTTTALPPGRAVAAAKAACVGRAAAVAAAGVVVVPPADLTVDAVRVAFPNTVAVCTGVTLASQVAAV